jgi:cyclic pyranopterin phosphate synthase
MSDRYTVAAYNQAMIMALPILDPQPVRPAYANGPRDLGAVKLLRISVTDRCNLRCVYCMPDKGVVFAPREDLLGADELVAVARGADLAGVTHFKITGGEPTLRKDLLEIVEGIAALNPADLSMTTNGLQLEHQARDLRMAGVDRLTISWDTMNPQRFKRIARGAANNGYDLDRLRRGIDAAVDAGFSRLKINVVVIGGMNDDEVVDFARLTLDQPWTVRFIEFMPLGHSTLSDNTEPYTVDNQIIRDHIEKELGKLKAVARQAEIGVGPANVFELPAAKGRIGFISAMSQPFCETCNRLRLTATGELRSCLFDGGEVSVLPALRPKPDTEGIINLMRQCVSMKPETHSSHGNRSMSQLGG